MQMSLVVKDRKTVAAHRAPMGDGYFTRLEVNQTPPTAKKE